ncbi:MAG: FMN-binding protein [Desulfobacterales bacterium]|nr:FMN-binding protein [Desulfobacterales bacterium]
MTVLRLFLGCLLFLSCAMTPPPESAINPALLKDGIYEGSYRGGPNKAVVRVSIAEGKISSIKVVAHQAWRGRKAEQPIMERIIATQSTNVDAVSGATNSSRVIMNAVQNAVEKAYSPNNPPW